MVWPSKENFIRPQQDREGRKESTSVNNILYDVVVLEDYLLGHPEAVTTDDWNLTDPRLLESVAEGHKYWSDERGDSFGPYDVLQKWQSYQAANPGKSVDDFLDHLSETNPQWQIHIDSLKHAQHHLENPIWIASGQNQYPFNGMHRLTRALMENKTSIPVVIWDQLPEEAILKKTE